MAYDPLQVNYEEWQEWQIVSTLTVAEAALLLSDDDPAQAGNNRGLRGRAYVFQQALLRDIRAGRLTASMPLAYAPDGSGIYECNPETPELMGDTEVPVPALIAWADARGISHGWNPASHGDVPQAQSRDVSRYPDELRAAIEAFEAVQGDYMALAGKTPKRAITDWLEVNRPELTANARERIATVANWAPSGGAPKTPGEPTLVGVG